MKKTSLKKKKHPISNIEEMRKLYKQGFTIRSISQYFSIPYVTLYRELKKVEKKKAGRRKETKRLPVFGGK